MDVLIPYAKQAHSGRLVSVDEVASGLECNCVCDCCGAPMVARKGDIKVHHFGHAPKSASEEKPCTFNFKRGCFWVIKQILEESVGSNIALPDYELSLSNNLARHQKSIHVTSASAPVYDGLLSFDVPQNHETAQAVIQIGEHKLRLIFGFKSPFKPVIRSSDNCPEVFVDLTNVYTAYVKERKPFIQIIKAHVFSDHHKQWLYHPRQVKYKVKFDAVCEEIIANQRKTTPVRFKPAIEPQPRSDSPKPHYVAIKPNTVQISADAQDALKLTARLDQMMSVVDNLYYVLNQSSAKHCDNCQFLYVVTSTACPTCGDLKSVTIMLDSDYLRNLPQKYMALSYVDISLKNYPDESNEQSGSVPKPLRTFCPSVC